jgi:hypothetical protein
MCSRSAWSTTAATASCASPSSLVRAAGTARALQASAHLTAVGVRTGIFHDKTSEHLYGTMDFGKTYKADPAFHEAMAQVARSLHIRLHQVASLSEEEMEDIRTCKLPPAVRAPASAAPASETKAASDAKGADKDKSGADKEKEVEKLVPWIVDADGRNVAALNASAELKGLRGFDGRMYVLDCIRMFPRDPNYPDPTTHIGARRSRTLAAHTQPWH